MKHHFYRLLAVVVGATATQGSAWAGHTLKPLDVTLTRPVRHWVGPSLGGLVDGGFSSLMIGPQPIGTNTTGATNIVGMPLDGVDAPISLNDPIVLNAASGGTLNINAGAISITNGGAIIIRDGYLTNPTALILNGSVTNQNPREFSIAGTNNYTGGTVNVRGGLSQPGSNGTLNVTGTVHSISGVVLTGNGWTTPYQYTFGEVGTGLVVTGVGTLDWDNAGTGFVLHGFTDGANGTATLSNEVLLKYTYGDFYYNGALQGDDFSLALQVGNGRINFAAANGQVIPEPTSLAFLSVGALALGVRRRRR